MSDNNTNNNSETCSAASFVEFNARRDWLDFAGLVDGTVSLVLNRPKSSCQATFSPCLQLPLSGKTSPSANPDGLFYQRARWNLPLLSGTTTPLPGDILTASTGVRWKILTVTIRPPLGRCVCDTVSCDPTLHLDAYVDLLSPVYTTNGNGIVSTTYQVRQSNVAARIVAPPSISSRASTSLDAIRIEIIFPHLNLPIQQEDRIRRPDGTIYQPVNILPASPENPFVRLVAQQTQTRFSFE